jgi:AcrR family transcriptional regulator
LPFLRCIFRDELLRTLGRIEQRLGQVGCVVHRSSRLKGNSILKRRSCLGISMELGAVHSSCNGRRYHRCQKIDKERRRVRDVSKSQTVTPLRKTSGKRVPPANNDAAAKSRVIDATIDCILELGFYRASTNAIAREAGVTWGVIQHYFGTREALMLSVLKKGSSDFVRSVENEHIEADTAVERMEQLIDIFSAHYAGPAYLADLQILLNMDRDPRTSAEVRKTMLEVAERSNLHVRRLLREALGAASKVTDLSTTIFLILRGFGLNQQLLGTMSYDTLAPKKDRLRRQRRLLAEILAPFVELASD